MIKACLQGLLLVTFVISVCHADNGRWQDEAHWKDWKDQREQDDDDDREDDDEDDEEDSNSRADRGNWREEQRSRRLRVLEKQEVRFGVIQDTARRCTMHNDATLSGDCFGTGYLGEMLVTGRPYMAFGMTVSRHGWRNGTRFFPKLVNQNHILDSTGQFTALVKGTMQMRPKRVKGNKVHMTYTVTVYYQ